MISKIFSKIIILIFGIFVGVSSYTFYYAKGYSYFSNNPEACANCHVMNEQFNSWGVSTHRMVTCNECHIPDNPITKYLVKGENGFRHSYVFTFQNPQVIRIIESGKKVVQKNCIKCHSQIISAIHFDDESKFCFDCHKGAGHVF